MARVRAADRSDTKTLPCSPAAAAVSHGRSRCCCWRVISFSESAHTCLPSFSSQHFFLVMFLVLPQPFCSKHHHPIQVLFKKSSANGVKQGEGGRRTPLRCTPQGCLSLAEGMEKASRIAPQNCPGKSSGLGFPSSFSPSPIPKEPSGLC